MMRSLRLWLVKKLAGENVVLINAKIYCGVEGDHVVFRLDCKNKPSLIANCVFKSNNPICWQLNNANAVGAKMFCEWK